ncbi:DUF4253 domain-containing protein [Actinacidiphila bryophytorum]|uniref:DUF4253 domain-containing protein n=1 Tax=Actinacidiphila bryophytorum TaxID=1436133 RepID=UPI002176DE05|nr:DUF4253 domain-containing protein [Actinacidiphila bryophytorum]UWE12624.1 DUF4253 domain-containing protein [Actinacidiphila bryophytorum]
MSVARLPDGLPPGRLVAGSAPGLWISDEPVVAPGGLWAACQAQQHSTGWCPVLMAWPCASGTGHRTAEIDAVDVAESLHESWLTYRQTAPLLASYPGLTAPPDLAADADTAGHAWPPDLADLALLADLAAQLGHPGPPYSRWPGLAAPAEPHPGPPPDAVARAVVGQMLHYFTTRFTAYLALARVDRSADLPAAVGWEADAPALELSALLRSWEDRFGARVIGFEGSSVFVSVASPPLTSRHAAHVALEHVLTGASNLNDGTFPFPDYAEALRGERLWSFWWD